MLTNCERVVRGTHDDNIRNASNYSIKSNVRLKTQHAPNIYMRKFDGKNLITWVLQMEKYFDLHNVKNTHKVCVATLYLEPNQFLWYRWLFSHKKIVTSEIFME